MAENLNAEGRVTLTVDADQLKLMVDLVADADRGTSEYAKTLDQLEKKLVSAGTAASKTASDIHKVVQAYAAQKSSLEGMMRFSGAQAQMETRFHRAQEKTLQDAEKAYQSYSRNILVAARNRAAEEQRLIEQTYAQNMPKALKASQDAAYESYAANIRYTQQQEQMYAALPRARYALYDVARTYGMVSAAALGAAAAVGTVGVSFQSSYAQVQRTTGVVGEQIGQLRRDLEDLTTVIPESFEDITGIASLGGQLGIAADGIEDFTEVTAKLTATTDLSADAAGTALGRFQALLGVPSHEFENLASSILKVGVNSVATETQIVQIATQISSMGDFAGLTADQVVGLAGALASTGTQPELARGTVTRLFTLMSKAVGEAGDQLDEFARVSRVSAEDFQRAWGTSEFADVFQKFLHGLSVEGKAAIDTLRSLPPGVIESAESFEDLNLQGNNVVETLNNLGITSVRDVPALLRLAGAGEVVANSFSDAASGYRDATELSEQYGIIAETVAAKLTTLGNTLKLIMANIADNETLNIIGGILSAVQGLAEGFLAIARNPVGKVILGIVAGFTALVGVITAVRAAQMMFTASLYAMVTAQKSLAGAAEEANISVRKMGLSMFFTGNAARAGAAGTTAFGIALRGLLVSTGVGAVLVGIGLAVGALVNHFKSAKQSAEDFFGTASSYTDAIRQDTQAFHETGEALRTIDAEFASTAKSVETSYGKLDEWSGRGTPVKAAAQDMAEGIGDAADETERFTIALGENFRAQMAQSLLNSKQFTEAWENFGPAMEAAGFSLDEFFERALSEEGGGVKYVQQFVNSTKAELDSLMPVYDDLGNLTSDWLAEHEALDDLHNVFKDFVGIGEALETTIHGATSAQDAWNKLMGEGADTTTDTARAVSSLTQEMIDATNAIWGSIDATVALENSMHGLGASIAENGLDFSATSEAGRANLSSLGQVINAVMADAAANGTNAADAIAGLMQALSAMGVNVAQDLAFLNNMVAQLGGTTGMVGVTDATRRALDTMNQGFGTVVPKAVNRTRDSVREVQKELRTTADYASDLASVFQDAFRFRFGRQNARDETRQLWDDMKQRIEDAKKRAKELRLEIQAIRAAQASLQSRKAILLYQLGVARDYGDTLREQQILAELGEIESDMADNRQDLKDKTSELRDAQAQLNPTLKGNTEEARRQRQEVQKLLESYAKQIEEAARNGASQKELEALAKKLKKEFNAQAKEIGFSKDELKKYNGAFDDMVKVVQKVPRNVNVKFGANASPAERALANFKAKMDRERKKIEKPFKVNARFNSKIDSNITGLKAAQQALAEALKAQAKAYKSQPGGGTRVDYWDKQVNRWRKLVDSYKGFAAGGFTGRGGKYEPAGTVHRGEFVFPKSMVNQTTGLPYANVLGSMAHAMGAMQGGSGTDIQLVELLPNQLRELARIVSTTITMDGSVIARATNGYNAGQYNRGAG